MTRLLAHLVMLFGAYGPSFGIAASVPPHNVRDAWDYACYVTQYDCSVVEPPKVLWQDLYNMYGIVGGYDGSDTIYMDVTYLRAADPVYVQSILAHEITHYLDVQLGYTTLPYTSDNVCLSEFRAWRVGNAYVLTHGRPDLVDFSWHIRYGCFNG